MNNLKIENILKTLSILYIENDEIFIEKLSVALKMKSRNLYVCDNVKDAIKIFNENKIDIVITEIFPENKSGIIFIKKIRNINDLIPIIVVSSTLSIEDLYSLIPLKLIDVILKPINLIKLKKSLYDSVCQILNNGFYEIEFKNNVIYNISTKELIQDKSSFDLSLHEVLFLEALIANRHHVLTQEVYKDMIWRDQYDVSDSAFKSLLNRLRNKIGKDSIKNISGFGYRLNLK